MYNALLLIMLISLIYNFLFKKKLSCFNCGIFAWTGNASSEFSPLLFNFLGTQNDSRGGDSCGVYFNRGVITGIGTDAKYESLIKSHRLHTTVKPGKWPIVIGHCRKASVGAVTSINIQPVLLRTIKDDKLVYVQAHNGTITNHKELATKYNITVSTDESDSVTMSKLIQKEGFKILNEYEGSAALVIHFIKEPNVLYAFHGESKNYSTLTEERPLHYVQIKGSGTYISSEASPLEWIANGDKATSFKYNVVYKLQGDSVEEFMKIDREKSVLRKYTEVNRNTYWNSSAENEIPFNSKPVNLNTKNRLLTLGLTNNICCCDIKPLINVNTKDRIRYDKGWFLLNDVPVHGEVTVDTWGYIRDKYEKHIGVHFLYFYYGILLYSSDAYDQVDIQAKLYHIKNAEEFYDRALFSRMSDILYSNALLPYTRRIDKSSSGYMEQTAIFTNDKAFANETFFCGSFSPPFGDLELHFKEGDCIGYERLGSTYTLADLLEEFEYLSAMDFGKQRKVAKQKEPESKDDIIEIKSCMECVDKNLYKDGSKCRECTLPAETPTEKESNIEDNSDILVSLYHTIGSEVAPILDDLESLINEVEISGYAHLVKDKHEILIEANNKLKELNV